jgi:hypothetical protein
VASVRGRNGSGITSWINNPTVSESRYTNGGRTRPRLAVFRAAFERLLF